MMCSRNFVNIFKIVTFCRKIHTKFTVLFYIGKKFIVMYSKKTVYAELNFQVNVSKNTKSTINNKIFCDFIARPSQNGNLWQMNFHCELPKSFFAFLR